MCRRSWVAGSWEVDVTHLGVYGNQKIECVHMLPPDRETAIVVGLSFR